MDDILTLSAAEHRQGGLWDYVSASRLNLWLRCPLAFRLKYVDGIVPPTSLALFLGQMVHRGLEFYYRHRQLGVTLDADGVADRLYDIWHEAVQAENVAFDDPAEEIAFRHQAVDLVRVYLNHVGDTESTPQAVETRLEAPLVDPETGEDLGISLVGIVDLVVDDVLVDFKTASRGGRPLDVIHEVQMSCYSYLFRHASGTQEAGLELRQLVKTKTPRIEFHAYQARTEGHCRRLFAVIQAYLDCLESGRFVFRPGLGCHMCEFRETHCCKWPGV